MSKYRYVGSAEATILDTPFVFRKYGQEVEIPDDVAQRAIVDGRIALIPADQFDSIGHPPKELSFHSRLDTHAIEHPDHPDFHNRKRHAWSKFHEHRDKLMSAPAEPEENIDA